MEGYQSNKKLIRELKKLAKGKGEYPSYMREYDPDNRDYAMRMFQENILNKTAQIFEYEGLPESIPVEILETFLQKNGNVFFHEVEGELYVFTGGKGGEPDVYYRPTIYTIANPALKYTKNARIGKDGILMRNDNFEQGLMPLIDRWGVLIIEAMKSFRLAVVNKRATNVMSASDDKTKKSAEEYQRQLEEGRLAIIGESPLLDGIKVHQTATQGNQLSELRESFQFFKAMLYSDLGMKVSHNMKREYVSEAENFVNDDTLLPLIDNMLINRQRALKDVNEMFGTNITVKLAGTWELQSEEVERSLDLLDKVAEGELELEEQTSIPSVGTVEDIADAITETEEIDEAEETDQTEEIDEVEETDQTEDNSGTDNAENGESDINIEINVINGDDSEINEEEEIDLPEENGDEESEQDEVDGEEEAEDDED